MCGAEGVPFAVNFVVHFKIVLLEDYAAFLVYLSVAAVWRSIFAQAVRT